MAAIDEIELETPENTLGEAVLASLSLSRILGDGPLRMTQASVNQAKGLPKTISNAVLAFLRDKPVKVEEEDVQAFDAKEVFARLRQTIEQLRLPERVDFSIDPSLSGPFFQAFGTAWNYMQALAPPRTKDTVLGSKDLAPNPLELSRFRSVWRVIEDPQVVLVELSRGVVPRRYVETLSRAYPDLCAYLQRTVIEHTTQLRAEDPTWEPTYRQDRALQVLLQTPKMNTRLMAVIQSLHGKAAKAETAKTSQRAAKSTALEANETPTQRITRK